MSFIPSYFSQLPSPPGSACDHPFLITCSFPPASPPAKEFIISPVPRSSRENLYETAEGLRLLLPVPSSLQAPSTSCLSPPASLPAKEFIIFPVPRSSRENLYGSTEGLRLLLPGSLFLQDPSTSVLPVSIHSPLSIHCSLPCVSPPAKELVISPVPRSRREILNGSIKVLRLLLPGSSNVQDSVSNIPSILLCSIRSPNLA